MLNRPLRAFLCIALLAPNAAAAIKVVPKTAGPTGMALGAAGSAISGPRHLSTHINLLPTLPGSLAPTIGVAPTVGVTPAVSATPSIETGHAVAISHAVAVSPAVSATPSIATEHTVAVAHAGAVSVTPSHRASQAVTQSHAPRHPLIKKATLWAKSLANFELPDPAASTPNDYIDALSGLLDIEQIEAASREARRAAKSRDVREELGTSVSGLEVLEEETLPGGVPVVTLQKLGSGRNPFKAIARGDLVALTAPDGEPINGVVESAAGSRVKVALSQGDKVSGAQIALDLTNSDITHKRMKAALEKLKTTDDSNALRLRDVIFGRTAPRMGKAPKKMVWRDWRLDDSQKEAVTKAMAAVDVGLIHGPPGTGKTTTLVELIWQATRRRERVLATAPSNVAVDNILEKLADMPLKVVRLGNPARVPEHLRHLTLDAQVEKSKNGTHIKKLREILAEKEQGSGEYYELLRKIRKAESEIKTRILDQAHVVLGTHGSISGTLGSESFDLVVLDEASQAVEPLSWIPLMQAKRAVFAGDHKQLPPTIQSQDAKRMGLATTLMHRLANLLPAALQSLLRVQYRMHEHIMEFSSDEFYDGQLQAHPSVANHLARDLENVQDTRLTRVPAQFVDTSEGDYREEFDGLTESFYNSGEARLIRTAYNELIASGLRPDQIGIITPYAAQKRLLRDMLDAPVDIEVPETHTVDGFQGREKEVILVSMVRSEGELGFLEELERLNVAITRPRRLRIVVGNRRTLARHPSYSRFLARTDARGYSSSAQEWLGN